MPELPQQKLDRYLNDYKLGLKEARTIVFDGDICKFYESCLKILNEPKQICNWLTTELLGRLVKLNINFADNPISPLTLTALVKRINDNTISGKIAKDILDFAIETGKSVDEIISEKNLKQNTDTGEIEKIINEIISKNQAKVEEYKSGKDRLFGFFVGEVMKATQGKANPQIVNEILKSALSK
jgi:aspartyl-tRNA(Asn)/glutamyl-tRNA(Gln) amidotransferase subunit B